MILKKRVLVSVAVLLVAGSNAFAEWKPEGPIKLMIAFAAGGGADTQARLIAEELEARHGWTVLPEQVTGKGGSNMAMALKAEPGDGTAIGMAVTETFGYNMIAAGNPYTLDDFTPLTTTAGFQMGIVSKADKGWKSFADMVSAAKSGETIRFGTMSPKLSDIAYLLGKATDVDFNVVQVKGGKAVMNGVNANDLDVGFMAGIQSKGVQAGDLVNLASGLSEPLVLTPDAPTLADLGVPFNADGYFVFMAPAGLPGEAQQAISDAIVEIISDESTKAGGLIKKAFGGPAAIVGADLAKLLEADVDNSVKLLEAAAE